MDEKTLEAIILENLREIQRNQQDIQKDQRDILVRLGKMETMIHERTNDTKELRNMIKSHEDRLSELESHTHSAIGAKEIVAWLVVTGIALWGVLK